MCQIISTSTIGMNASGAAESESTTAKTNMITIQMRISEIERLIDEQLAIVPDNPIHESYKAKNLNYYVSALRTMKEIERKETNGSTSSFDW